VTRAVARQTDPHEMRVVAGRIRAVYTDSRGRAYYLVDGEVRYVRVREVCS